MPNIDSIKPASSDSNKKPNEPIVETDSTEKEEVEAKPNEEVKTEDASQATKEETEEPKKEEPQTEPAREEKEGEKTESGASSTQSTSTATTDTGKETAVNDDAQPKTDDSFDQLFSEPTIVVGKPPSWIWWAILMVGAMIIGMIGFGLVSGRLNQWLSVTETNNSTQTTPSTSSPTGILTPEPSISTSPSANVTNSPAVSESPSPAASSSTSKSFSLRVLNGTTTSGLAASAKATLTKAGFTVRTTGNAANQNYAQTTIYYQTGHLADAQAVQASLTQYQALLEESTLANPDNVLVVIGLK